MLYAHIELLDWLKNHDLIKLSKLEEKANLPKDTLRHFLKDRRDISNIYYEKIKSVLFDYGFISKISNGINDSNNDHTLYKTIDLHKP